ncbi:NlpC/P60 family protein [Limosilactobacillus fastidiosus]|uniref:C40 family peptidase n=1 Tax=Limosilactobacillus fastidiosus TaxID=2759855 RepID=A0A7W3TY93_9LACO|nr:NlpC/P60 family protein [Limosilactobacillus fastidiosus]MBB1062339.1 C40 family peptidase [Limosilactobacillus fastidiosus]MBB1085250.1 C40 family peptidase [Limosilactobacillus fastidiosus]MCD7083415.1 NlpC/P60 family protein [Limosilactobacillus fastidiosus]MCD7085235.1 NlpC/P60 family protein [Limosilactobacillus fastidiosus]MCD7115178.1 NlpC/P60 family protein [Limosilactobacillus fastidiosus]
MVKKVHKYSSSKRLVAGTVGALSVFALTAQANNTVEAKAKNNNAGTEQPESMSSSASAIRNNNQLSLAPMVSSSSAAKSASTAHNGTYVVKSGDTLSELAVHFNVTLNDLVSWNHIQNPDLIYVGQQLLVEGKGADSATIQSSTESAQPQSYTVAGNGAQQDQPQQTTPVQQSASQQVTPVYQQGTYQQATAVNPTTTAYTSDANAAAYNSAVVSQQGSTVAVASQPVASQQTVAANSTATAYTSDTNAAAYNSAAVTSQQSSVAPVTNNQQASQASAVSASQEVTANSSTASQQPAVQQVAYAQNQTSNSSATVQTQSQPQQSQVASQQPQTTTQNNVDLHSGSVVSLASKIANSNSVPYQWGGNSLSGMDCSGFVQYVYANAEGKQLPHNTVAMESYVNSKPASQAQSGDLLFWGNHGSTYHVGIYVGNNQYAAAAKPGTNVAVYNLSPNFAPSFAGTVK